MKDSLARASAGGFAATDRVPSFLVLISVSPVFFFTKVATTKPAVEAATGKTRSRYECAHGWVSGQHTVFLTAPHTMRACSQ